MSEFQSGGYEVRDGFSVVKPESGIFFPVTTVPAELEGERVPGWIAVIRTDNNRVLSFQRRGYRIVPNEELFPDFEASLASFGLDPAQARVRDSVSRGGAQTFRSYQFSAVSNTVKVGDVVNFELQVANSYDGSRSFCARAGGERLMCLNGMTLPNRDATFKRRHTAGFVVESVHEQLARMVRLFHQCAERWEQWTCVRVGDREAEAVFEAVPGMTDRLKRRLSEDYWSHEKASGEQSLWGVYNAMTAWATHGPVQSRAQVNAHGVHLDRNERVLRAIESDVFGQLEGRDGALAA